MFRRCKEVTEQCIKELIENVRLEDLEGEHAEIANMIGVENFLKLTKYVKGGMVYIPIPEMVVRKARNRAIYSEWKEGKSKKELSEKYDLSFDSVIKIIRKMHKNS